MRTQAAANSIARRLGFVAEELRLRVGIHLSDGSEPVGRGIGPTHAEAGIVCTLRTGDIVDKGQPLFEVHANSRGELAYALQFAAMRPDVVLIAD